LPFDFCIKKGKKLALVEYQGQQHYMPVTFGSKSVNAEKRLKTVKNHDDIKRRWCKKKNIPLLEVPYWEYEKITTLLHNFLKTLSEDD